MLPRCQAWPAPFAAGYSQSQISYSLYCRSWARTAAWLAAAGPTGPAAAHRSARPAAAMPGAKAPRPWPRSRGLLGGRRHAVPAHRDLGVKLLQYPVRPARPARTFHDAILSRPALGEAARPTAHERRPPRLHRLPVRIMQPGRPAEAAGSDAGGRATRWAQRGTPGDAGKTRNVCQVAEPAGAGAETVRADHGRDNLLWQRPPLPPPVPDPPGSSRGERPAIRRDGAAGPAAKWPRLGKRATSATLPMMVAAMTGPTPKISVSEVPASAELPIVAPEPERLAALCRGAGFHHYVRCHVGEGGPSGSRQRRSVPRVGLLSSGAGRRARPLR
jgi:hypothetical protein